MLSLMRRKAARKSFSFIAMVERCEERCLLSDFHGLRFNPVGTGEDFSVRIIGFDAVPGNALIENGGSRISFEALITNFIDSDGRSRPLGVEFTMVGEIDSNYGHIRIFADESSKADGLTGEGFDDGTLVLEAMTIPQIPELYATSFFYKRSFIAPETEGAFEANKNLDLYGNKDVFMYALPGLQRLDQFGPDNFAGGKFDKEGLEGDSQSPGDPQSPGYYLVHEP